MRPWKIRVIHVTTAVDPNTGRTQLITEPDPAVLELPGLPVDDARARAKELLRARGLEVRSISTSVDATLLAYVNKTPPAAAKPDPGWVHKFPAKPPRP